MPSIALPQKKVDIEFIARHFARVNGDLLIADAKKYFEEHKKERDIFPICVLAIDEAKVLENLTNVANGINIVFSTDEGLRKNDLKTWYMFKRVYEAAPNTTLHVRISIKPIKGKQMNEFFHTIATEENKLLNDETAWQHETQ